MDKTTWNSHQLSQASEQQLEDDDEEIIDHHVDPHASFDSNQDVKQGQF